MRTSSVRGGWPRVTHVNHSIIERTSEKSTDVMETKLYFIYLLFFSRLLYTYFCSIRKKGEVQGEVKRGLRHWVMRLILWDSQPVLQNKELLTKIKCTARKHPDGWKMNFQCVTGMWFLNVRINKILENSLHFFFFWNIALSTTDISHFLKAHISTA